MNGIKLMSNVTVLFIDYKRYIDMSLYLYGFEYNSSFADSNNPVFQSYARRYCKEVGISLTRFTYNVTHWNNNKMCN